MSISMADEQASQGKLVGVMIVVAIVDLSLLSFASYLIYKVFKLVGFTDVPMLLSIMSVALALLCFLVYSVLLIVQAEVPEAVFLRSNDGTNMIRVIDQLKVMFTFCAFVFDLYKWCLFIVATSTDVSQNDELSTRRQRKLQLALYSTQTAMITLSLVFMAAILIGDGGTPANTAWIQALRIYTVTSFGLFLLVYLAVLYLLTSRLKRYFPKFYQKERAKIIVSTGVILLSLVSRISFNVFIFLFQSAIDQSYAQGTWLFPGYQFVSSLFASLFPLAAIITSLLYAINHKKRMVRVSVKAIHQAESRESMQSLLEYEEANSNEEEEFVEEDESSKGKDSVDHHMRLKQNKQNYESSRSSNLLLSKKETPQSAQAKHVSNRISNTSSVYSGASLNSDSN